MFILSDIITMTYLKPSLLLAILLNVSFSFGQPSPYVEGFAHTYSIVALDHETGEMAVGVQSHWFSVGTIVAWGKSGVGVVATQSFVNPAYGPEGLQLMASGLEAGKALELLVLKDEGKDFRQVAFLDIHGNVGAHTGDKCIESAGHLTGENFSVQANMMLNDEVVPAMKKAFLEHAHLPLAERVLKTLLAAENAGGDIRGKQSAALIVVGPEKTEKVWADKMIDIRVDDHANPLEELERLLQVHRAYDHMNKGDLALEKNDMHTAMKEYHAAQILQPQNVEMKYWTAVTMANNGQLEASLPVFKEVFAVDGHWKELTKRLLKPGLLTVSEEELELILNDK